MAEQSIKSSSFSEDDDSKIFPQRLMEVLADEANANAICWLPHGRAFIIRDRELFAQQVMPKFFPRKAKYSSFTRKLNRWNFVRVSSGPELGAYYHEFFLRDKPHLSAQMFCKNARTKLAMANDTPAPAQKVQQTAPVKMPPMLSPALIAAINKEQMEMKAALPFGNGFGGNNNLRLIEHQIQLLQQEQAQRVLLERLRGNTYMSTQQQQLLQMRHMMQAREQQQHERVPTNPRASAA